MRRKEDSDGEWDGCSAQLTAGVTFPIIEQKDIFSLSYQQLLASCSNITYHKYNENGNTGYIEATDCVNGTWFQNGEMARVDYETLLVNFERYRSDRTRMVVSSSADQISLIPWEEDITILNDVRFWLRNHLLIYFLQTRIMKNQEGCVNTLSMECMDFYYR